MLPRLCIRLRFKYIFGIIFVIFILDFFGTFTHYFEIDFYKDFHYPLDGDVIRYARQIRSGQNPDIEPINIYNYSFIYNSTNKCNIDDIKAVPKLVFIIKSALKNFKRRNAIRNSWGFEKRFSDVLMKTIFVLGIPDQLNLDTQKLIDIESDNYQDIVQANFIDAYFNNTIKTMMGIKWAIKFCSRSKFYMFVDDDFYVSTKNVLRYIRNPVNYPEYLEEANETLRKLARKLNQSNLLNNNTNVNLKEINHLFNKHYVNTIENKNYLNDIKKFLGKQHEKQNYKKPARQLFQLLDMELPSDVKLFSGFVFSSAPHRHKSSKWHVTLGEYQWHMWPPYVTAGAFILSREALIELYYTSMYTKHFK